MKLLLKKNLNDQENRILELKYKSIPFKLMQPEDVITSVQLLLLKIYIITGWQILEGNLQNVLVEQLCKKIMESYPNVNVDEVEYAFRNTKAKDWGKNFNLSLFDEVLEPYLIHRVEVSRIEERIKAKPVELENRRNLSDEEMESWINEWVENFPNVKILLIPIMFYDWLDKKGLINLTNADKKSLIDNSAISIRKNYLAASVNSKDSEHQFNEFLRMEKEGLFTGAEVDVIKTVAKKVAVHNYLQAKFEKIGK